MPHFKKRPLFITAEQWTGNNLAQVMAFIADGHDDFSHLPNDGVYVGGPGIGHIPPTGQLIIPTLEGEMTASLGDWIIKGIKGEFYPCKPDIFEASYESVDADERNYPLLGYATTQELIVELAARAEVAKSVGEKWPRYSTVNGLS